MPKLRTLLEAEDFKKQAKAGKVDADALVRKGAATQVIKDADPGSLQLTFKISDPTVDRDNDTIAVEGWQLNNFAKSGSMLWAHDPCQPPVAGPRATWTEGGAVWSKAEFLPRDVSPFSYMVYQMYTLDVLRGVSVGFRPLQYTFNEERGGYAIDFVAQELLEFSATPVPSNPNAILQSKSLGIDTTPVIAWCERILDECKAITGATPEQVAKTLKEVKSSVSVSVKAGRALSKANEEKLRAAHASVDAAYKHIADVLSSVDPEPMDDEESTTGDGKCAAKLTAQKVDGETPPQLQSNSKKIDAPADHAVALLTGLFLR
jgi:hypothetical protein